MSRTRTLKISVRVIATATVVDLEGTVDLQNSRALRATLFETVPATFRLALNMSGVRYIDSSGIATLIEVLQKARDLKKDGDRPVLLADQALERRANLIGGANKEDYHLKNLTPGKNFHPTAYADLRAVTAGEACPTCGKPLRIDTAVEVGHIFKLGYRYSESMGARVLDKNGKEVTPIMGSYGIGIERILTAAVEQSNDENGFWLPPAIAPFQIVVTPTNVKDESLLTAAVDIAKQLEGAGFDVILDDRNERPGVKFKDADLVGIPFRITVGNKVTEGTVEVVLRSTREVRDVRIAAVVEYFQGVLPARA